MYSTDTDGSTGPECRPCWRYAQECAGRREGQCSPENRPDLFVRQPPDLVEVQRLMVAEGITPEAAWEKLRAPQRKLPVVHETVAVSLVTSAPKKWSMDELRSAVERSSDPEELLQFAKIADQHDWSRLYTTAINKAMKMA